MNERPPLRSGSSTDVHQCNARGVVRPGLVSGECRGSEVTGGDARGHGPFAVAGPGPVVGQHARWTVPLERLRPQAVQPAAFTRQEVVIAHGLSHQRVAEPDGVTPAHEQVVIERVADARRTGRHTRGAEHLVEDEGVNVRAGHGDDFGGPLPGFRQPLEPGQQDVDRRQVRDVTTQRGGLAQLLEQQWVARRAAVQGSRRDVIDPAGGLLHQSRSVHRVEAGQPHDAQQPRLAQLGRQLVDVVPLGQFVVATRQDERRAAIGDAPGEERERLTRRPVGPLEVVDHDDE